MKSFLLSLKDSYESVLKLTLGLLLFSFAILICSDFHVASQIIVSYSILLLLFLSSIFAKKKPFPFWFRTSLVFLGLFLTLRYMYWRATVSVTFNGFYDFFGTILLFLAEIYSVIIYILGVFSSLAPLERKVLDISHLSSDDLPTVDVFIPTYSEPIEIVSDTVLAATSMDYPADRFRVFILDDGGTDQKCNDLYEGARNQARARKKALQEVARATGAEYLTRSRNIQAKAGNLNNALLETKGDLILILDCDHIPTRDFLKNTVGWFLKEPKMFLVQTPHSFYNADPIERNMRMFGMAPGENQMFYQHIQKGHDFWESSFFCGSAALLRRKYLEEVGGIAGDTITEDAETAITLHARGYRSAFIAIPMIRGRNPDTFASMVVQRIRWTQGMIQIFMLKNPLRMKGLKWYQRLSYLSASGFWFFAFSRVVFMLAPLFYLYFGLHIYRADGMDLLGFTIPHVIAAAQVSQLLYSRVRWSLFSEMYETAISFFTLPAILEVLLKPRDAQFKVTPKGEDIEKDFISHLVYPFIFIFILIVLGYLFGIYRWFRFPLERYIVAMTLAWNSFNLVLVMTGLAISSEKGEKRRYIRVPSNERCEIDCGDITVTGSVADLSMGGVAVKVPKETTEKLGCLKQHARVGITIFEKNEKPVALEAEHIRFREGMLVLRFLEAEGDLDVRRKLVNFLYGDETRWIDLDVRKKSPAYLGAFYFIFRQSLINVRFGDIFQAAFMECMRRLRLGV
jgi:cellulose synthase (UDP-forming)